MTAGRERVRRLVHIAVGVGAAILPHVGWKVMALACAVATLVNGLVLPRWRFTAVLLRTGSASGRLGLVAYPAVLLLLLLLFRERIVPVQAAWLALAVGDGTAPWFGRWIPKPRWPGSRKSMPGTAAAQGLAALAMLALIDPAPAILASALASLGDAQQRIDDNVAVPLLAAAGASLGMAAA